MKLVLSFSLRTSDAKRTLGTRVVNTVNYYTTTAWPREGHA
jgi:hypothetical protein